MASGSGNVVGIDLGTTMSVIAHLDSKGSPATIPNSESEPLTPSVVYLDGSTVLVGKLAKEAAAANPSKAAVFVKRDISQAAYSRLVDGRSFRPETLSAMILRKLKESAEQRIGPISKAVITVPAFFDDRRRKATEDAGRIAGLDVVDVLNEPTAAALAYAMGGSRQKGESDPLRDLPGGQMTAVVYDLGGGTFDATVVRLRAKHFETLATDGDFMLGGKDWDDKIVEHVTRQFEEKYGIDTTEEADRIEVLRSTAEKSKILLSRLPNVPIEFSLQGKTLKISLNRQEFEDMSSELLMRTRVVTNLVVKNQAKLDWGHIDRVLLVGGSTRMSAVKTMLRELTGMAPDERLDADQVVAHGAAIHAGILAVRASEGALEVDEQIAEELRDVCEINVNSHSLGIEALRHDQRMNSVLIPKNTALPFAASKIYRLRNASATTIPVRVLEGESTQAANNIQIGQCRITDLRPNLPKGAPVQVRLAYGANGRVSVMALDMTHGCFAQAEIHQQNGLSEVDIEREAQFVQGLEIY